MYWQQIQFLIEEYDVLLVCECMHVCAQEYM